MSHPKKSRSATVLLTERALSDLREIDRYSVKKLGRKTADRYLDSVELALDRLQTNPELLRQEPEFGRGFYFYRVQKHLLVCDYRDDVVVVITVIHTSMDCPARLAELAPQLAAEVEFLHNKLHTEP